ncbi:hypothetical protein BDR22DRAFT_818268 [Usnea florida]
MALAAIFLYLILALLASSTPLQLVDPQTIASTQFDPTLRSPNLTTLPQVNPTTVSAVTHCFIQPTHPGAPTLFQASYYDCLIAVTVLRGDQPISHTNSFSRQPSASVRLPYSKNFRTCKIILDIVDESKMETLRWEDITDTLESRNGVLNKCLGQGSSPPLGGRTLVGTGGVMHAIVVGQQWNPGAVA